MRIVRGIGAALRSRWGVFASVAAVVLAIDLFLPPVLLSIVRKPFDYFAFNAWLPTRQKNSRERFLESLTTSQCAKDAQPRG